LTTPGIMRAVLLALLPGALAQVVLFGPGYLVNVAVAVTCALAVEALATRMRGQPLATLRDASAIVTATLLALALPPATSPAIVAFAVAGGLLLGKHVYGGLGANPFNPAMVGYALVLISFPRQLASWPAPMGAAAPDAIAGATPLERFMHRGGLTVDDIWHASEGFGHVAGLGWEWINLGFLAGGLWLVGRRLVDWRIPTSLLASLGLLAALGHDGGSSASLGSPTFHWFSGGTMLAAFFIATDPVTAPTTRHGRIVYGASIGALIFAIRGFGAYPDGIAFAVLLGNAAGPMLDHLVLRRRARHAR
jgi:Na+-translocating ferredoxin:NAD+ oxidoreductase subunit D